MKCIFLTVLLLLLPYVGVYAQSDGFVIIAFSVKRSVDKFPKKDIDKEPYIYTWVIPSDSITHPDYSADIVPFAIDDLQTMHYIDKKCECIDMMRFREFICAANQQSPSLIELWQHRKLLQEERVKWPYWKRSTKVKIYAIPVKGDIHFCKQRYLKGYSLYYTEKPLSYWPEFWDTPQAKDLMSYDYSNIEYDFYKKVRRR